MSGNPDNNPAKLPEGYHVYNTNRDSNGRLVPGSVRTERLRACMDAHGLDVDAVMALLSRARGTVRNWYCGHKAIPLHMLELLERKVQEVYGSGGSADGERGEE